MSKAFKHHGSGFSKQMLIQFQSIMALLLPRASKLVLHHGGGKMYVNFRTRLISFAIRTGQLDHFKLIFENQSITLENMAKVSKGLKSQNVWQ